MIYGWGGSREIEGETVPAGPSGRWWEGRAQAGSSCRPGKRVGGAGTRGETAPPGPRRVDGGREKNQDHQ